MSYDVIRDDKITTTDFSNYAVILVTQDVDRRSSIPFTKKNALFFDERIAEQVWSGSDGGKTSNARDIKITNNGHEIFEGINIPLNGVIDVYPVSGREMHSLRIKPSFINSLAIASGGSIRTVIGTSVREFNGIAIKDLFFGLIDSENWNNDTKVIFKNSLL